MATDKSYGTSPEDITSRPAEAGKGNLQSSHGDLVNEGASQARWGKENTTGIWSAALIFGGISIAILIAVVVVAMVAF